MSKPRMLLVLFALSSVAATCSPIAGPDPDQVQFVDLDALYVGSFASVEVTLPAGVAYTFDDLTFTIDEGEAAGEISLSRDETFDPEAPTMMLLAGWQPGEDYTLRAWNGAEEVGSALFDVSTTWDYEANGWQGPPQWIANATGDAGGAVDGAAWGSDDWAVQNANTKAIAADATTRQLAVVLIEFDDYTFGDPINEVDDWKGWIETDARSANSYFQDLSNGALSVQSDIYGPYTLNGTSWDDLHDGNKPLFTFYQACASAADADVIAGGSWSDYHTIVCIAASGEDDEPFTWPYGSSGQNLTTSEGNVYIGTVSMPEDWQILDGRGVPNTMGHELGHTLRLPDLYTPRVPSVGADLAKRNVGAWDLMHDSSDLPFITLGPRLMLGLIDPDDILALNPSLDLNAAGQISQRVTLSPVARVNPDGGNRIGVEFRLADGWNYYMEYRVGQAGLVGDQGPTIPAAGGPGAVLITDVMQARGEAPMQRPSVMRAPDWPLLEMVGDTYVEEDLDTGNTLSVEVMAINEDEVDLWIRYGNTDSGIWDGATPAPDPSIRPWPAADDRPYQSPDITVTNAVSEADPVYENVAISGIPNTLTARVRNHGNIDASGVTVSFHVKDQNIGSGVPKAKLGSVKLDVPADGEVDFVWEGWTPDADGHYCVVATIDELPGEMSSDNNSAQSNYDVITSPTASPAARIIREISIHNPYDQPSAFNIQAIQDSADYRTYLETTELILQAGETRTVRVMFEYARDMESEQITTRAPNRVVISGHLLDPRENEAVVDYADVAGGVDFLVLNGWRTSIQKLDVRWTESVTTVSGVVIKDHDGTAVTGGKILAIGKVDELEAADWPSETVAVQSNGTFQLDLFAKVSETRVFFLPADGGVPYAMSDTDWFTP